MASFKEAFAAAHKKLGPGKTFTWNGKKYTTDRADDKPGKKAAAGPQKTPGSIPKEAPPKDAPKTRPKARPPTPPSDTPPKVSDKAPISNSEATKAAREKMASDSEKAQKLAFEKTKDQMVADEYARVTKKKKAGDNIYKTTSDARR